MRRHLFCFSIILAICCQAATFAQLANSPWPMFQGDTKHTGRSMLPGPKKPLLLWTCSLPAGTQSSPVLAPDGTIYVGCVNGYLYAISPEGQIKWGHYTTNQPGGIGGAPAVDVQGTIYVGAYDGGIYAINPDGSRKWRYGTGYVLTTPGTIGPDGTIYFGAHDGRLYALNANGTAKWICNSGIVFVAGPAIADDGTIYVATAYNGLRAVNPNGSIRWTVPISGQILSSPTVADDGTVYVGCGQYDTVGPKPLTAVNPNGTIRWQYVMGGPVQASSGLGHDGTIYTLATDSYFYALSPTGGFLWRYYVGAANTMAQSAPAIGADGLIYVGCAGPMAYCFQPDGTLQWQYPTEQYSASTPCIAPGERLYFQSSVGKLYCFGNDDVPPTTTALADPGPNALGWNTEPVTISLSASDSPETCSGVREVHYCAQGAQTIDETIVSGDTAHFSIDQEGITEISYWSVDNLDNAETAKTSIVKIDRAEPHVSISANPSVIWSPNGKMVPVTISGEASDGLSDVWETQFTVTDEYGRVQPQIHAFGDVIQLEARRYGSDNDGRTYTISVMTTDQAGNTATASTTVLVPHSMKSAE